MVAATTFVQQNLQRHQLSSKAYTKPCQTSKIEHFSKIVDSF